ncbi:hypothetical protein D3C77_528000 [compost metagenome]
MFSRRQKSVWLNRKSALTDDYRNGVRIIKKQSLAIVMYPICMGCILARLLRLVERRSWLRRLENHWRAGLPKVVDIPAGAVLG